jgi:hypothetical protein
MNWIIHIDGHKVDDNTIIAMKDRYAAICRNQFQRHGRIYRRDAIALLQNDYPWVGEAIKWRDVAGGIVRGMMRDVEDNIR